MNATVNGTLGLGQLCPGPGDCLDDEDDRRLGVVVVRVVGCRRIPLAPPSTGPEAGVIRKDQLFFFYRLATDGTMCIVVPSTSRAPPLSSNSNLGRWSMWVQFLRNQHTVKKRGRWEGRVGLIELENGAPFIHYM
jgi:hypothetical protein